ncbi:MAG: hypothetical protein KC501_41255 [Myxococcales bacterium]|nr:hypothetical protein [Myxococcales bacterium]
MRTQATSSSLVLAAGLALGLGLGACDQDGGRAGLVPDGPTRLPGAADSDGAGGDGDQGNGDCVPGSDCSAAQPEPRKPLTAEQTRSYLSRIAPIIAGRSLRYEEAEMIIDMGEEAIEPMVRGWVDEPGFAEAIRYLVQEQLHASGERDGVDYELPGNLAAEIAREHLPWSTILTADYCVDGSGEHIECDTGAPYAAGVLATRAYLIANKGRFNLSRAKLMLETFACRIYPMEHDIQPPLEKSELIPMFRAESAEEQVVEEAQGGFGNGIGCYFCHSQFSAHAQLFVRFDAEGTWRADGTGQQDPYGELGRSFDGLYASHLFDPYAAADESSQVFGQRVANLREAGEVIADHELFPQCTVKNLVADAFNLKAGASDDIAEELVVDLADIATADDPDPGIADYMITVFTDERVVDAVVANLQSE